MIGWLPLGELTKFHGWSRCSLFLALLLFDVENAVIVFNGRFKVFLNGWLDIASFFLDSSFSKGVGLDFLRVGGSIPNFLIRARLSPSSLIGTSAMFVKSFGTYLHDTFALSPLPIPICCSLRCCTLPQVPIVFYYDSRLTFRSSGAFDEFACSSRYRRQAIQTFLIDLSWGGIEDCKHGSGTPWSKHLKTSD